MQTSFGKGQEIEGGCDTFISPEQECALHPLIHSLSPTKPSTTYCDGPKGVSMNSSHYFWEAVRL
jgi:hypothetical protein